jgi:hypothetical protein
MAKQFPESHNLWIEQCNAAEGIRAHFGRETALEYLIGQKLLAWVSVAERQPEFAAELPRFVARLPRIFTTDEIEACLNKLGRSKYRRRRDPRKKTDQRKVSIDTLLGFKEYLCFLRMRQLLGLPRKDDPNQ